MHRISEEFFLIQAIAPASRSAGAVNGSAVDMRKALRALCILDVGDIGASTTFDAKLQQSDDGSTGWADIANAAITQLGATDDNKLPAIDLSHLIAAGALKGYVRVVATVGGSNAVVFGAAFLVELKELPVTQTVAAVLVP
jgi:hypothetical protein